MKIMKAIPINTAAHQNSWKEKINDFIIISILFFYIQIYTYGYPLCYRTQCILIE